MHTTHLEVPVVELLGAGLAAEVPGHPAQLPRQASLAQLVAVVTRDALQAQALDEVLLEKELAPCKKKNADEGKDKKIEDEPNRKILVT